MQRAHQALQEAAQRGGHVVVGARRIVLVDAVDEVELSVLLLELVSVMPIDFRASAMASETAAVLRRRWRGAPGGVLVLLVLLVLLKRLRKLSALAALLELRALIDIRFSAIRFEGEGAKQR
jgi:hypothetical protein